MAQKKYRLGLLGGGSWATAIAKMLVDTGSRFSWYMRSEYAIEHIIKYKHNPNYISAIEFDVNQFELTSDINKTMEVSDVLILAIPSVYLLEELQKNKCDLKNKVFFSAIKGILSQTGMVAGEYLQKKLQVPYTQIGVITGPCHAEEVALERLSYLTVASVKSAYANFIKDCISNHYINVKITKDTVGAEYAGVLKNIYSVAAGVAHGLGYGDNFQSVLMSNSIREMEKFMKALHKIKRNITESAYLGDLLVTGYSVFSRNRTFGTMVGKGYTIQNAIMEMNMVVEGYYAVKGAYNIVGEKIIKYPIIETVYEILYKEASPKKTFKKLTEKLD